MTGNIAAIMMQSSPEKLIGLYHNGFIICLAFSILFFIVSVILFLVFHIKDIFDVKTGRAQKRKIDEMQRENALTGRLITPKNKRPTDTSGFSGKLNKIKSDLVSKRSASSQNRLSLPKEYQRQAYPEQAYKPKPLVEPPVRQQARNFGDGSEGTSLLGNSGADFNGSEGTSLLSPTDADLGGAEGTSVLGTPMGDLSGAEGTSVLGAPVGDLSGAEGTSVLGTPIGDFSGAEGTSVLGSPMGDFSGAEGTSVLGTPAASIPFSVGGGTTGELGDPADDFSGMPPSKFVIVKNTMLIHTQETIY